MASNQMHGARTRREVLKGLDGGAVGAMRIRTLVITLVAAAALLAPAGAGAGRDLRRARRRGRRVAVLQRHARRPPRAARRDARSAPTTPATLGVAWKTPTPDGGVIHSTPVVVDGCVFTGTDLGNVYALNADTGEVVWTQALGEGGGGSALRRAPASSARRRSPTASSTSARPRPTASVLSALDQATGEIVWQTRRRRRTPAAALDSSPVPFNGMVFQAFKGDESSNHSNPGFAIVDGSREGGGADPREDPRASRPRTSRPATAAARSSTRRPSTSSAS